MKFPKRTPRDETPPPNTVIRGVSSGSEAPYPVTGTLKIDGLSSKATS